ncbi:hypothetical protein AERO9A_300082 [Aeromonas salmonicida]|nr:hypothetical protein AERO9A_300082 [Aeromonas salmonicida]
MSLSNYQCLVGDSFNIDLKVKAEAVIYQLNLHYPSINQ